MSEVDCVGIKRSRATQETVADAAVYPALLGFCTIWVRQIPYLPSTYAQLECREGSIDAFDDFVN
jgi:hypothetical protein